uniref:Uncharacterized protein n=1 Tax=viral metagenome TaxID=1070528 RepID=A0A6C0LVC4_9ZZZZ
MSFANKTRQINPAIRYNISGNVPDHVISASTALYSDREHISNMKSPLFAATVSYLHSGPYPAIDLMYWPFTHNEYGEGVVDIPMCQCNFETGRILSLVPSFVNAGYYISIVGNDRETFVAVYTKFRRADHNSYWNYNLVLYPTDPVHLICRNLFKIIIKLQRWKWRALKKGYAPPEGRLFNDAKRSFDEMMECCANTKH